MEKYIGSIVKIPSWLHEYEIISFDRCEHLKMTLVNLKNTQTDSRVSVNITIVKLLNGKFLIDELKADN